MKHDERPQLIVVAGPNGAGKSSISKYISSPDALIFDPDREFKRLEIKYPDLPAESIAYATDTYFLDQVDFVLMNRRSFTIETNFRDAGLMDTVTRFKDAGYVTGMVYMLLPIIAQSIERVKNRVREGGHFVDEQSIRYNFSEGRKNLVFFSDRFDNLELLDSSGAPEKAQSLLRIHQHKLIYEQSHKPDWAKDLFTEFNNRYERGTAREAWEPKLDLGWKRDDDDVTRSRGLSL